VHAILYIFCHGFPELIALHWVGKSPPARLT